MKRFIAVMLAAGLVSLPALAGDWFKIEELQASGKADAKEVKCDHKIAKARIVVTEGTVIINGFVIRRDGKADYRKVGQRLEKGEKVMFDIGDGDTKYHVDGFRISDDGKGSYKVEAKK